ncbi:hypothetical protein [Erysipelothrix piscisicarius]|uniref:hypothetical protein n=2 Tax=Erysipelothrix TaxID=1647 RepID=UPI00190E2043|nr:hypothetical protein [Erysipelothrix sp. strain 2 (EsS2-6-Brazil)]
MIIIEGVDPMLSVLFSQGSPIVLESIHSFLNLEPLRILALLVNPMIAVMVYRYFLASKNKRLLLYKLWGGSVLLFILNAFFNAFVLAPQYQVKRNLCLTFFLIFLLFYLYEYFITEKYPTFQLIGWICLPITLLLSFKYLNQALILISFASLLYILKDAPRLQFSGWIVLTLIFSLWINPFYFLALLLFPFSQIKKDHLMNPFIPSLILIYHLLSWSFSVLATYA